MNAAWGTMLDRDRVALNLTETHKTVENIKERKGFVVHIADAAHVVEADKMKEGKVYIDALKAIAFDPYTHGYYLVSQRVGEAFKDAMKLK